MKRLLLLAAAVAAPAIAQQAVPRGPAAPSPPAAVDRYHEAARLYVDGQNAPALAAAEEAVRLAPGDQKAVALRDLIKQEQDQQDQQQNQQDEPQQDEQNQQKPDDEGQQSPPNAPPPRPEPAGHTVGPACSRATSGCRGTRLSASSTPSAATSGRPCARCAAHRRAPEPTSRTGDASTLYLLRRGRARPRALRRCPRPAPCDRPRLANARRRRWAGGVHAHDRGRDGRHHRRAARDRRPAANAEPADVRREHAGQRTDGAGAHLDLHGCPPRPRPHRTVPLRRRRPHAGRRRGERHA